MEIKSNYSEDKRWQVAPLLSFGDRIGGTEARRPTQGTNVLLTLRPNVITSWARLSILMFEIVQGQILLNENEQMHQCIRHKQIHFG